MPLTVCNDDSEHPYENDDWGVEWYDDIDELENGEDLVTDGEDAAEGAIRADGFEKDGFLMNSDDDDEEAMADKAMMRSMEKSTPAWR